MWSLGRNKSKIQSLPPAEQSLRGKLIVDFQRARYGATCRTLAFPTQIEGEIEYYRAVAMNVELDQWLVQRVVESPVQLVSDVMPVSTPSMKVVQVKDAVGFLDALSYLARFEMAQDKESVGPDKDQLGHVHYYKLAMLHDIIFDVHGTPQPTIAGQAVISETYPIAVMDDLEVARGQDGLKKTLAKAALSEAYSTTSQLPGLFDRVKNGSVRAASLSKAIDMVGSVSALVNEIWSRKQYGYGLASGDRFEAHKTSLYNAGFTERLAYHFFVSTVIDFGERFPKLYKQGLESISENKDMIAADKALCERFLKEVALIACVQDAHALLFGNVGGDEKKLPKSLDKLSDFYIELNQWSVTAKFTTPFYRKKFKSIVMAHVPQTQLPEPLQKLETQMRERLKAIVDERKALQNSNMKTQMREPK